MQTAGRTLLMLASILMVISAVAGAVRVLPASHHLDQEPGTVETYTITVLNDTDASEELRLYIGDWQRFEDGEHDWGIPINSARWIFDRSFVAGDQIEVVYQLRLPESGNVDIVGTAQTLSPQETVPIVGVESIDGQSTPEPAPPTSATAIWVGRTIEAVSETGLVTVRLSIQCNASFENLIIQETTSERALFADVDSGGSRFDTINRSNAAWLTLSNDRLVLEPDEMRDIVLTIDMPDNVSGTYWSAVFVESQPQTSDTGGTRVVSIYRTAIKVYVTAFGTDLPAGQVVDVQLATADPLAFFALFENTGNIELVVTGDAQVIDRTGEVIRELPVDEFRILPGAKRIVTILDETGDPALVPDIYQAVISLDYGADSPVVGVRGFRIR